MASTSLRIAVPPAGPALARQLTALRQQGRLGPGSLASAVWWQGLRRSVLLAASERRASGGHAAAPAGAPLAARIGWVETLLDSATPVSERLADRLARRPMAFGRTWNRSPASLLRLLPQTGRERVRRQHLHTLAARLWQTPDDQGVARVLAEACKAAGRSLKPASLRRHGIESVDLGLLAISLLLALAALRRHAAGANALSEGRPPPIDAVERQVARVVARVVDQLQADPQQRGPLNDHDHLGCVVALRALLAAQAPAGDDRSQRRHLRHIAQADQWLGHALKAIGPHSQAIEWLVLAGLVQAGGAENPALRWQRLRLLNTPLAAALATATAQARLLRRPDGTLAGVGAAGGQRRGGHPAGRVLRTVFRAPAEALHEAWQPGLAARVHQLDDSDDGLVLATRIFGRLDIPDPGQGSLPAEPAARPVPPVRDFEWIESLPVAALTPVETARLRTAFSARADSLRHAVRYRQRVDDDRWQRIDRIDSAGLIVARGHGVVVTLRNDQLASDIWTEYGILSAPASGPARLDSGAMPPLFSPLRQLALGKAASTNRPAPPLPAARLGHKGAALWGELSFAGVWFGRIISLEDGWLNVLDVSCSVPLEPCRASHDLTPSPASRHDPLLLPVSQTCPA